VKKRIALSLILGLIVLDAGVSLSNTMRPTGILIHHTALPDTTGPAEIEQLHKNRGFGAFYWWKTYYIGYHYLILPDGQVIEVRPEHLRGAHAAEANDTIGICLIGNFDSSSGGHPPTEAQMKAVTRLSRELIQKYHFSISQVRRHLDVEPTLCPGDLMPWQQFIKSLEG